MRIVTFNKLTKKPICLYCKKNEVEPERWNKKCEECKQQDPEEDPEAGLSVGQRQPAAVWENEQGEQIFVDKFGREVDNPGYDTKSDPRGWQFTGAQKDRVMIK